ncbi:MAG TPA: nucleotidyltransferase family protein [Acidobacteriota bacterium]|jgi:predicted nucleotidyltransferase|nr:nucleotidyltransferase family protein [Acidobacteriota bacterium]HQO19892.1 nucleotidyltransferase family protein [Acidobacteriota bacterium]HQQ46707.1 nucleotidyltransferase family protein [Acidobacteriota bacterium]
MRSLEEIIKILSEKKDYLETSLGVTGLKAFGSFTEGTQGPDSDLDLIVEFKNTPTMFEFVRIEEELSRMVSVDVDLLTEEAISPYILSQIKPVEIL